MCGRNDLMHDANDAERAALAASALSAHAPAIVESPEAFARRMTALMFECGAIEVAPGTIPDQTLVREMAAELAKRDAEIRRLASWMRR